MEESQDKNLLEGLLERAYAGLQKSLEKKSDFVQRVTPGVGATFGPFEEALQEVFVLDLFRGLTEGLPTRDNTCLPVNQAGMAITDPVNTAPENWTASCVITGRLVAALRGQAAFRKADHTACLRGGRLAVRHRGEEQAEEALTAALEGGLVLQARRMRRAAKTGAWLMVLPSTVNGTELRPQEWRDALFLWYGLKPPDLPTNCDGCEARFTISHTLDCKKGGLVTARHNEIREGVADLADKALTPAHVRDDPLIYSGCAMSRTNPKPAGSNLTNPTDETTAAPKVTEQKGDLLLRYLWKQGTDSVHDMRVVNTDAL